MIDINPNALVFFLHHSLFDEHALDFIYFWSDLFQHFLFSFISSILSAAPLTTCGQRLVWPGVSGPFLVRKEEAFILGSTDWFGSGCLLRFWLCFTFWDLVLSVVQFWQLVNFTHVGLDDIHRLSSILERISGGSILVLLWHFQAGPLWAIKIKRLHTARGAKSCISWILAPLGGLLMVRSGMSGFILLKVVLNFSCDWFFSTLFVAFGAFRQLLL